MRVAYADPPYLGCGKYYMQHHPDALAWDSIERHQDLIMELMDCYPDGWALSASSTSINQIGLLLPRKARMMVWVKPFASFKPNVNPAYAWEPVFVYGGRKRTREQPTVRDWVSANITLETGMVGAKPPEFCEWLFAVLNLEPTDEFVDMFPGSGNVTRAWERFKAQMKMEFK